MLDGNPFIDFRFVRRGDERGFPSFTCTVPVPSNREIGGRWVKGESLHPYPWELLVQRLVRHSALYLSADNWIRLGVTNEGHVASYCAVARKAVDVFEIAIIAVSSSYQGRGLGRDALADAIRCARAQSASDGVQAKFVAYIDIRNDRSARLFHDFGFEPVKRLEPDRRGNVFAVWALK